MPKTLIQSNLHELESHKTVIVIDRGPKFAIKAAEFSKTGNVSHTQSRWSCSIQAVIEFHRVIADIYPNSTKLIRLVVSDTGSRFITPPWAISLVPYKDILCSFIGDKPDPRADPSASSITNGLVMCMDALAEPTPLQKNAQKWLNQKKKTKKSLRIKPAPTPSKPLTEKGKLFYEKLRKYRIQKQTEEFTQHNVIRNTGTVIALTTVETLEEYIKIVNNLENQCLERNELYQQSCGGLLPDEDLELVILPINSLKLYVVNVSAFEEPPNEKLLSDINLWNATRKGIVQSTFFFTAGGQPLFQKMHAILHLNYGIESTIVQNIPMKEEAQSGKSTNYNVEMFHPKRSHSILDHHQLLSSQSPIIQSENGYRTTVLKWSSVNNKFTATDPPLFENGAMATVARARDRAAICICNFIVAGKYVLLDMNQDLSRYLSTNFNEFRISNFFSLEHNLASMFLNAMRFDKYNFNPLRRSPATSLIFNMIKFIEFYRLELDNHPVPLVYQSSSRQELFDKVKGSADHFARYWPIHETDSIIFQKPEYFEPLIKLFSEQQPSLDVVANARQFIYNAVGEEFRTLHFPISTLYTLDSTTADQVKAAKLEIARLLRNYATISQAHSEFYNFYISTTGLDLTEEFSNQQRLRTGSNTQTSSTIPSRGSRNNSPVPSKRAKNSADSISFYDYFSAKAEQCWRGWKDFEGRARTSGPQHLYPHLKFTDAPPAPGGVRPSDRRRMGNKENAMEH